MRQSRSRRFAAEQSDSAPGWRVGEKGRGKTCISNEKRCREREVCGMERKKRAVTRNSIIRGAMYLKFVLCF